VDRRQRAEAQDLCIHHRGGERPRGSLRLLPSTLTLNPRAAKPSSSAVGSLIEEIVPGGLAILVPVQPRPRAIQDECFGNVAASVAENGGSVEHGWSLWELPRVLIEAEFHAVWRTTAGDLIDVSPSMSGESHILFLPDPHRVFEGRQVPNVRRGLRNSPGVREFIRNAERLFDLHNEGELADKFGLVRVPAEVLTLRRRQAQLQALLSGQLALPRNSPCPCGSGERFKRCCGKPG
jgi:hypothetical protein